MSPSSLFFFNIVLATWSSLKFHICLSIGFSISVKLVIEVLIGITLYLSGGIPYCKLQELVMCVKAKEKSGECERIMEPFDN